MSHRKFEHPRHGSLGFLDTGERNLEASLVYHFFPLKYSNLTGNRKRSDTEFDSETESVCSNSQSPGEGGHITSEFKVHSKKQQQPMAQEWKEKYTSIYLNLLHMAMIGNFPYPKGNLYDFDFWEAFTIEFNRLITTRFPKDNFTGFTIKNVIMNGRGLEACYTRHTCNSCQLENFADYDRCFNGLCNNSPVFPHFEAPTSTSTCSLDMSRATTSGNGGHLEMVALRLSTLVNDGILDAKKCPKVLEHFLRNDALAQTWIKVKGDVNQMAFLNNL